jgi:hypothetical protein
MTLSVLIIKGNRHTIKSKNFQTINATHFIPYLSMIYPHSMRRGSSIITVSGYGLDDRVIDVRSPADRREFFCLTCVSRPALGPNQPPVQWVPGVLSPGVKRGLDVTLTTHPI